MDRSKEWTEAMKVLSILLLLGFGFVCVWNTHYLLSKIALAGIFLLVGAAYFFLSKRRFSRRDEHDEE
jgi:4-hydroxybenzoate polyprenyltransferase